MTAAEWVELAKQRTTVTVDMASVPSAPATLIGYKMRQGLCHVEFASGKRASIRPGRVTVESHRCSPPPGTIGGAADAATPTVAANDRWASKGLDRSPHG